jgi:Na+-transporting NADH:ubiquinone oxidoreductase subunit NqrC
VTLTKQVDSWHIAQYDHLTAIITELLMHNDAGLTRQIAAEAYGLDPCLEEWAEKYKDHARLYAHQILLSDVQVDVIDTWAMNQLQTAVNNAITHTVKVQEQAWKDARDAAEAEAMAEALSAFDCPAMINSALVALNHEVDKEVAKKVIIL